MRRPYLFAMEWLALVLIMALVIVVLWPTLPYAAGWFVLFYGWVFH